jgi:hypothetical protein
MKFPTRTVLTVIALAMTSAPGLAQAQQAPAPKPALDLGLRKEIEPQAIALIKAMCDKLAAAKTMTFTAVATYESPARTGEPLAYTTLSNVTLQRPDKLRVVTPGDGPPSEFIYDGKTVTAYEPTANLAAVAEAPPTIDAMLEAAYEIGAIYFPFTDAIVSDPLRNLSEGLEVAFVVGKSQVVGGVPTDIVVLAGKRAHAQIWIGSEDKLPRMVRVTFLNDPAHYRHVVEFSNWKLDAPIPADAFSAAAAAKATRIPFAVPTVGAAKPAK